MSSLSDDPAATAALLDTLYQVVSDIRVVKALTIACAALLVYDILLTLNDEIAYVWRAKLSVGKVLYFLNRYPIVAISLFLVSSDAHVDSSLMMCRVTNKINGWSMLGIIIPVQLIFCLRTFAVWEQNTLILLFLCLLTVSTDAVVITFIKLTMDAVKFSDTKNSLQAILGCYADAQPTSMKIIIPAVAALMLFDVSILILTLLRIFELRQNGGGNGYVVRILFRDGLFYYIIVLLSSISNIVLYAWIPERRQTLTGLLVPILRTTMNICANRLVLNLRGAISGARGSTNPSDGRMNPTIVSPTAAILETYELSALQDATFFCAGEDYVPRDREDDEASYSFIDSDMVHSPATEKTLYESPSDRNGMIGIAV